MVSAGSGREAWSAWPRDLGGTDSRAPGEVLRAGSESEQAHGCRAGRGARLEGGDRCAAAGLWCAAGALGKHVPNWVRGPVRPLGTVRCAPQKGRGISRQLRVPTLSGPVLKTVVRDAPKCGLELTNVDFFFLTNCGYKRWALPFSVWNHLDHDYQEKVLPSTGSLI
jgi:hypothetical protein